MNTTTNPYIDYIFTVSLVSKMEERKRRVLVCIVGNNTTSRNTNVPRIERAFSDTMFLVRRMKEENSKKDSILESLQYWKDNYDYCSTMLIIRDDSIIVSGNIKSEFRKIDSINSGVVYFSKWGERCNLLRDYGDQDSGLKWCPSSTSSLSKNKQQGICDQCILFTRSARDYYIKYGKIEHSRSLLFVPNIVSFDCSLSCRSSDYERMNLCEESRHILSSNQVDSRIIWFLLLLIIVFIVAIAVLFNVKRPCVV